MESERKCKWAILFKKQGAVRIVLHLRNKAGGWRGLGSTENEKYNNRSCGGKCDELQGTHLAGGTFTDVPGTFGGYAVAPSLVSGHMCKKSS